MDQLAINAYEATYDSSRFLGGPGEDEAWNGDWEGKSYINIGEGYWSVELAEPYNNLGITPQAGSARGITL